MLKTYDTPEKIADAIRSGRLHRCPTCGVVDTPQVGHCADGRYGGCGRSFSSDAAYDAHHYFDEELGRYVCLDPGSLLTKAGEPRFVGRPSQVDGHLVWGAPGSRPAGLVGALVDQT